LVKRYVRRKKDNNESAPSLVMDIVRKKSRAYELRHFSMLKLRELEEFHSKTNYPRKWSLSKDEKRLILR
jgi:hypothetical protein